MSGRRVRFCTTVGHENVPAAAVGTFAVDDDTVHENVTYCGECTEILSRDGTFRRKHALKRPLFIGAGTRHPRHLRLVDAESQPSSTEETTK